MRKLLTISNGIKDDEAKKQNDCRSRIVLMREQENSFG